MNILVANWKMAPDTPSQAISLAKATAHIAKKYKKTISLIACVPFIHLATVQKVAKSLVVGAQGVAGKSDIAQTGLVSAAMLKGYKAAYALIGHSETRDRGEGVETIKAALDALLEKKITPILCVGEKERDSQGWYLSTIKEQLESALRDVSKAALKKIILAYEPVWAIGKNAVREATTAECQEMMIFIRKIVSDLYDDKTATGVVVLYGGSVHEDNAGTFISEGKANGLLVGRVSLEAKRFAKIAAAIAEL